MSVIGVWRHVGGGCGMCSPDVHGCDDEYEHAMTGERVTVFTTQERHFDMPEHVGCLADLLSLSGVSERVMARPARSS